MIDEASRDIERERFQNYLESLRLKYDVSDKTQRAEMLGSLENFVGPILFGNKSAEKRRLTLVVHLSENERALSTFNPKLASKIRIRAGYSKPELASELGIHPRTLYRYELGEVNIGRKNRNQRRYFEWLKEVSGYNPFNL